MATSPSNSPSATTLLLVSKPITTSSSSPRPAKITSSPSPGETTSSPPCILPELIPLVASRLTSLQDFCALRAACRTYRALLPPSPSNLASQASLLLVPHMASDSEAPLRRRLLCFCLPHSRLFRCGVSLSFFFSFGCRVAIHDLKATRPIHIRRLLHIRRRLHIRHLLTGEQARLPDPTSDFDGLVFSGDLVLIYTQYSRVLYHCRIGDAHWREARCDAGYRVYNLMFLNDTLYALVLPHYRLALIELRDNSVKLSFLGDELSTPTVQNRAAFWLAECRGQLLLVISVLGYPWVCHVFQWQTAERKWARTTSLGGCSLFFNRHQFAGCLGPDHPQVRRDCLLFTWSSGMCGEYSLVDGSWHEHDTSYGGRAARNHYGAVAWVLPSIG